MTSTQDPDLSLADLIGDLTGELSTLVRKELELARIEAKHEVTKLVRGAGLFTGAAAAAFVAAIIVSIAAALWIAEALNVAVSFGIVGAVWVLAAAVAYAAARASIARVRPMPETADAIRSVVQGDREHVGPMIDPRPVSGRTPDSPRTTDDAARLTER